MSQWQRAMSRSLMRMAAGITEADLFAVERTQQAGTPSLWEEQIALHHGQDQHFSRVRSPEDDGGDAIGHWWAPASPERAQAIARALAAAAVWELESSPARPGEEVLCWRWVTEVGVGQLSVPAGSPLLVSLMDLDLELRQVANDLTEAHEGAELTCQVSLQPDAGGSQASIWLVNEGSREGLVPNPLLPSEQGCDFLRLELGHLSDETPGVTDDGIIYGPLAMPAPAAPPPPWDGPYVPLRAGDFLELPLTIPVNPPPGGRHFLRAVVSRYDPQRRIGQIPVLGGRVFSEEHELEVVNGAVQIMGADVQPRKKATHLDPSVLRTVIERKP